MPTLRLPFRGLKSGPRTWFLPLFWLFDRSRAESAPGRVAAGTVLGMAVGFTPTFTLHGAALLAATLIAPVNPLITLLSSIFFTAMAGTFSGGFHWLGYHALSAPALQRFYRLLFDAPLVPYTGFQYTLVTGSFLGTLAASVPLYLVARWVATRYGNQVVWALRRNRLWAWWSTSWLRRKYLGLPPDAVLGGYEPEVPAPPAPYFRSEGAFVVAVGLVLGILAFPLFFDTGLRWALSTMASRLNGAQVNITSLSTSFLRGEIVMTGVEIGNPVERMRNVLEVERFRAQFRLFPLFQRKLHVDTAVVEGIRLNARRDVAADLPEGRLSGAVGPGVIERVATAFYGDLRRRVRDNPLRTIGRFATGIDIGAKADTLRSHLQTDAKLNELTAAFDQAAARWNEDVRRLPGAAWFEAWRARWHNALDPAERDKLREDKRKQQVLAKGTLGRLVTEANRLDEGIAAIDGFVDRDITLLRDRLDLPRTDFDDLTPELLGSKVLNVMEHLSYWVDLSRRRMPPPLGPGPVATPGVPPYLAGTLGAPFAWTRNRSSASLFVDKVTFTSTIPEERDADPSRGNVVGVAENISSDPATLGLAATFQGEADFPGSRLHRVKVRALFDHTKPTPRETIALSAERLPLVHSILTEMPDLHMGIEKARAAVSFEAVFEGPKIDARWRLDAVEATYYINCRYKQLQETLSNILRPVETFRFEGTLDGNVDKLNLKATSEIGRNLAEGLRYEYRHAILAIDDNLRRLLLDNADATKQALIRRSRDLRRRLDAFTRAIENGFDELDTAVAATATSLSRAPAARKAK